MRGTPVLLIGVVVAAHSAAAQARFEPNASVALSFGWNRGQTHWAVASQAQPVDSTSPAAFDSLAIGRSLRRGLMASALVTWFRSPHVAITGELGYITLPSQQHCRNVIPYYPERERYNEQACGSADGKRTASAIAAFQVGGAYRPARGVVQPYVRASAGLGLVINSFVETRGHVISKRCIEISGECDVALYTSERHGAVTWIGSLATGMTVGGEESVRLRLEIRAMVAGLPAITGPTPLNEAYARTSYVVRFIPALTAGLDVPLVRKYERRY